MKRNNKNIELLAPAGSYTSLQAAVCAGADAVYLGLNHFNARRGADNFNIASLKNACDYAHLRGVKIYLTLNIIVMQEEFNNAMQLAYDAANAGVDAFIVQDIGLAYTIAKEIPHVALHISTQMNIHDEVGLRAVKKLGAKRVTLARELSLDEISNLCNIAKDLNLEIETFGHGAICICYSGQCLLSSMIGGRSANRGTCAQACRLNYELKSEKWKLSSKTYEADETRGNYLLSPKDLCTIDILPQLYLAGVQSIKIEGRMKNPEYVYEVVDVYRHALDNLHIKGPDFYSVKEKDKKRLSEAFSRGFSTAYMENKRGNEIMSYQRPNNRGVNIGRVVCTSSKNCTIKTKENLNVGDILEVWTKRGRSRIKVDKNFSKNKNDYKLNFNIKDNSWKNISNGDRVFRVHNSESEFSVDEFQPKVEVDCKIYLHIGKPANIEFITNNKSISLDGDVVEKAKTKVITENDLSIHIKRSGQTPFKINNIDFDLGDDVGISFSTIHKLRNDALKNLEKEILDNNLTKLSKRKIEKEKSKEFQKKEIKVFALATNPNTARVSKRSGAEKIYVPSINYKRGSAVFEGRSSNKENSVGYPRNMVLIEPVVYSTDNEYSEVVHDRFRISEDEQITNLEIGQHVPVVNIESAKLLHNLGYSKIWLSPELTLEQIKDITLNFQEVSYGLYIVGSQELMISKHCHLMSLGNCSQNCKTCERRLTYHYLLDRKGYEFPVFSDEQGYSHIYNSVSTDLCHILDELIEAGIDSFMVDTTLMNSEEAANAVGRVVSALKSPCEKSKNTTTGHIFRKVL